MTIVAFAHELAARISSMAQDSPINNAYDIEHQLEALFKEMVEQNNPQLRSDAEKELDAVRQALIGYPLLPDDCWIGDNSTDDKVLWLVRRLLGAESELKRLRELHSDVSA